MTEFLNLSGRYALLTKNEEIELGRRIQRWLKWSDGPCPPQIERSGRKARERFVLCNLRLVTKIAKGYMRKLPGTGLTFEDLLHEGVFGLTRAAEKYNPESGYAYSTYATWWIRQSISRSIETKGGIIKVSAAVRRKLRRLQEEMLKGATLQEAMTKWNIAERELEILERANLCAQVAELDGLNIHDCI